MVPPGLESEERDLRHLGLCSSNTGSYIEGPEWCANEDCGILTNRRGEKGDDIVTVMKFLISKCLIGLKGNQSNQSIRSNQKKSIFF